MRSRLHRLLWTVRIGRCGPLARGGARLLRRLLPVRGVGPLTSIVLGAPNSGADAPALATIDGVSFELDLREALHRAVYLDLFSLELRRVVLALLGPGDLFVDVGANFGFWALPAARRGCSVIAVEPVPPTRARLARNAQRNGLADRIEIVAEAMSDAAGELRLSMPGVESGQASVHADTGAKLETFAVTARTLDAVLGERHARFLKIDVEGHEPAVLRGASRLLAAQRADYVLLEMTTDAMSRAGSSALELTDAMQSHGYAFVRFIRANEGLFPRGSYGRLTLAQARLGARAGDVLWARPGLDVARP